MTRADIERDYRVVSGRITSPGKFEGEPVFAPFFYEQALEGFGLVDSDVGLSHFRDDSSCRLSIFEADRASFPELGTARWVIVREDEDGFVHCETKEPPR